MAKGISVAKCACGLSHETEAYLLAIHSLSPSAMGSGGYAKTNDLAKLLGVKSPSVTQMLSKLSSKGLAEYEKYKGARLTRSGLLLARECGRRKEVFEKFLKRILVSPDVARKDSAKMETNLDSETLCQLSKLVQFLDSSENIPCLFKCFGAFCRTGKMPACSKKGGCGR
ncbi:MAG: metal-dependent transcriptional regulator [Candidatus Bilamarchaeaceae archaeon]